MQIEREVTDILMGTITTFLIFTVELSPTQSIWKTITIISNLSILFLNFGHLILKQLNWLTDEHSQIVVGLNFVFLLISFSAYLLLQPIVYDGFWIGGENSQQGYTVIGYLAYFILGFLVYLSRDTTVIGTNTNH